MVTRDVLLSHLNTLLKPQRVKDYAPNGLQVEGKLNIHTLVTGVTACQALLDEAVRLKADAVLVHHGYFWEKENPCLVGLKHHRIATLIKHELNLFAYHLPLDIEPEFGNNAALAQQLSITVTDRLESAMVPGLIYVGELQTPLDPTAFSNHLEQRLAHKPIHIPGDQSQIKRIAWCTGAAQSLIQDVLPLNVDAYLSGEISEATVHIARESGLHYYAAGHHATERYGVKLLGELLAKTFDIAVHFIDIDNPV